MASDSNANSGNQKLGALLRSGDPRAARLLGARGGKASHGSQGVASAGSDDNEANA